MSHCTWNFLQNNFKPILDVNNIKITASKGRTTLDCINGTVKKILNPIPARNAAFDKFIDKRLKQHQNKNKPIKAVEKRQHDIGIQTTANQTMRKRDRSREALNDSNTSQEITGNNPPTPVPRRPVKNKYDSNKKSRSNQGQHQILPSATAEQPARRPDEAKSETRSHGMTNTPIATERKVRYDPNKVHFLYREK